MKPLLLDQQFSGAFEKLAADITEYQKDYSEAAFVGIHTRGVPLANRLVKLLKEQGHNPQYGLLDINLYRDDLTKASDKPIVKETKIDFNVDGKTIFLCDDVLYTGRTIRAAMDAIFDLGRPQKVLLVVAAKRNGRELPIDSQFCILDVDTKDTDNIKVKFLETDGVDDISVLEKGEY